MAYKYQYYISFTPKDLSAQHLLDPKPHDSFLGLWDKAKKAINCAGFARDLLGFTIIIVLMTDTDEFDPLVIGYIADPGDIVLVAPYLFSFEQDDSKVFSLDEVLEDC